MNVTKDGFKDRQLHMEDYLQMVSAEQKEHAGVSVYQRITENNDIITDFWTDNLLELILRKDNLNKAYKKVKSNKGKGGIDGMQVDGLLPYLKENQSEIIREIREGKYKPNPVRRVEIPKEEKGEVRKLGMGLSRKMCKFYKIFLPAVFKAAGFTWQNQYCSYLRMRACILSSIASWLRTNAQLATGRPFHFLYSSTIRR